MPLALGLTKRDLCHGVISGSKSSAVLRLVNRAELHAGIAHQKQKLHPSCIKIAEGSVGYLSAGSSCSSSGGGESVLVLVCAHITEIQTFVCLDFEHSLEIWVSVCNSHNCLHSYLDTEPCQFSL